MTPLDKKPYTVPHLKALISGSDVYSCQVCRSNLIALTFFQKLPILHHRKAKSRFVLLFAVYFFLAYNYVIVITLFSIFD